jgi:hypothetical protein
MTSATLRLEDANEREVHQFIYDLKEHPDLTELTLYSCTLDDEAVENLAITLESENKKLTSLSIRTAKLKIEIKGATALAHLLNQNTLLHLKLRNINISPEAIDILAQAVATNICLEAIDVRISLTLEQILNFTLYLQHNKYLKKVKIELYDEDKQQIHRFLNPQLQEAFKEKRDLNSKQYSTILRAITCFLRNNPNLTELHFPIDFQSAEYSFFLTALRDHPKLTTLNLYCQGLYRQGSESEFALLLQENNRVSNLSLAPVNKIQAKTIIPVLVKNELLTTLTLYPYQYDAINFGKEERQEMEATLLTLLNNNTLTQFRMFCSGWDDNPLLLPESLPIHFLETTLNNIFHDNKIKNIIFSYTEPTAEDLVPTIELEPASNPTP